MTTTMNAYIHLRGNAREALDFYASVFGGEVTRSTFGESGMSDDPAIHDWVMHSQLVTEGGMTLMASDTPPSMDLPSESFVSMSLSGPDVEELTGYFEKLSASGTVTMPFELAPWGDRFGMCQDAYGVSWMVNAVGAAA
jgi:PhnB protein